MSTIYDNGSFDNLPAHISWEVNGVPFSTCVAESSNKFKFTIDLPNELLDKTFSVREEGIKSMKNLYDIHKKTLAICVSGGVDSEAMAIMADAAGVPYELWYLDIWGNSDQYEHFIKPLETKLNKTVNVITLNRDDGIAFALEQFKENGIDRPTYLMLPYLFEKIPTDQYIVVGDGDLEKYQFYSLYVTESLKDFPKDSVNIPVSLAEIAYRIWAQKNEREGQYYFYNSTPELILAVLNDPDFESNFPIFNTKKVMSREFPEIINRKEFYKNFGKNYIDHFLICSECHEYAETNFEWFVSKLYTITRLK